MNKRKYTKSKDMNELPDEFQLEGEIFGHLTVVKRVTTPSHLKKSKRSYWECSCVCGNVIITARDSLIRNGKISCGCIKKPRKKYERIKPKKPKDKDISRMRSIWYNMNYRCYDENDNEYHNYGAKGIAICDRWLDFNNFKEDMYDSYMEFERLNGEKTATIDRIDSNENYCPENCRWATQLEQARNRSNNISVELDGVIYGTISQLAEAHNISYSVVHGRYRRGIRGFALVDKSNLKIKDVVKDSNQRVVKKLS